MPTCPCPSDPGVWSVVWSVVKWLFTGVVLTWIAFGVYSILFWRRLWFAFRAFNRLPSNRAHEQGWRRRITQSTSFLAAAWYLKDLAVPRGLGQWLFGNVAPGIPFDHKLLAGQRRVAERAVDALLSGPARIVIFTGPAGWGKTYTSHTLKTSLEPLAQVDVSWTMISASPESRIVEEFLKLSKLATAGRSASLSFEHLEMLSRHNRAKTSPHFFAHVHDFEAIAIESQALASARSLIERVGDSPHISLVITTRHNQGSLGKLLPILTSSPLVRFFPIEEQLSDDDISHLLGPERPVTEDIRPLSPLQLTLLRHYDEHTKEHVRLDSSGGRPTSVARPSPSDIPGMYRELFSYLKPAHQVCLQLLLARLVVSPERLFVRDPEELLARLGDGHPLLRLFAYVEGEGEGNPVARLAHPTVLALYTNDDIMSATTRRHRHEQWAEVLGAANTEAPLGRLQRVRHELRAQRGRVDHEEQITSVTHGGTLTMCRFLFETRSDFQEYFPGPSEGRPESASTILLLHDTTEDHETYVKEYVRVIDALVPRSPSTVMWAVSTVNLVKMMELLYQGLDAWEAANTLADYLKGLGEGGLTYGSAMNAVFEFDYNGDTPAAIESSNAAFRALAESPGHSPFTRATMLINEGMFRNNRFRIDDAVFDEAGRLYQEAEDLIKSEMALEPRGEYRLLMVRELLRVASGQLRWTYLKDGASVDVAGAWKDAYRLVEREAGWPMATPLQEFAYFALNASFIELAREGPTAAWQKYYEQAKNHQEAAGDTWFRLRLDQMAVFEETLYRGARRRQRGVRRHQDRVRALKAVIAEMLEIPDWTGIAFCAYQIEVMQAEKVDQAGIKSRYEEYVDVSIEAGRTFEKRLERERLFAILCGDDVADKRKYFPAWTRPESPSPMPLNLHGLLLLRSVSLLDQANWRPARG